MPRKGSQKRRGPSAVYKGRPSWKLLTWTALAILLDSEDALSLEDVFKLVGKRARGIKDQGPGMKRLIRTAVLEMAVEGLTKVSRDDGDNIDKIKLRTRGRDLLESVMVSMNPDELTEPDGVHKFVQAVKVRIGQSKSFTKEMLLGEVIAFKEKNGDYGDEVDPVQQDDEDEDMADVGIDIRSQREVTPASTEDDFGMDEDQSVRDELENQGQYRTPLRREQSNVRGSSVYPTPESAPRTRKTVSDVSRSPSPTSNHGQALSRAASMLERRVEKAPEIPRSDYTVVQFLLSTATKGWRRAREFLAEKDAIITEQRTRIKDLVRENMNLVNKSRRNFQLAMEIQQNCLLSISGHHL